MDKIGNNIIHNYGEYWLGLLYDFDKFTLQKYGEKKGARYDI